MISPSPSLKGARWSPPKEGTFAYDEGAVVTPIVFPHTGYDFVNWTGDVETVSDVNAASTVITMNGDYLVTANFE
jgi:uncharacterized repeat protein (TIGR02543 family)